MSGLRPWPRGIPLAWRLMVFDRLRLGITVAGIGVAVMLVLFLMAVHDGIQRESNGYVERRPVAAWIAQENTTNFVKSSSFLPIAARASFAAVPGVEEVTPMLRLITTLDLPAGAVSVIVVGIETLSPAALPDVRAGRAAPGRGELVLDGAFARRHALAIGDTVTVQGRRFTIVGLSHGTNAVLTQFGFIALADAHELLGVPQLTSFFLVRAVPGVDADTLVARLAGRVPRARAFTRDAFARANLRELQEGLIPILVTVATMGGVVALIVLTLLLSGAVLEQRETYAVLKALGASSGTLARVVVTQSLAAVLGGVACGVLLYALCAPIVLRLVPLLALALHPAAVLAVASAAIAVGLFGALTPLWRVAHIHPAELFRA